MTQTGPNFEMTPAPTAIPPRRVTRRAAHAVARRDEEKVRAASRSVGVAVALAAGAVVLLGAIILISMAMMRAVQAPPGFTGPPQGGPDFYGQHYRRPYWGWINADDMIWVVAILAVVSIALTGAVGWFVSKRAVAPLAEALRLQRHFVADASHELRTPLTALSSRVQILQRRLESGKPVEDVVAQLQTDADTMTHTLSDLLLTAEGSTHVESAASLDKAVQQAVSSLEVLSEQSGVTCVTSTQGEPAANVPLTSLTRAIVAIVDNAIQHSPEGSTVEISSSVEDGRAVVRVCDHGAGIVGVDPEHVFDRFAHGSETGRRRSFGLGLALASEVAQRFGGDIAVETTGPTGTVFLLGFPNVIQR